MGKVPQRHKFFALYCNGVEYVDIVQEDCSGVLLLFKMSAFFPAKTMPPGTSVHGVSQARILE